MKRIFRLLGMLVWISSVRAIANPGLLWELAKTGQWAQVAAWLETDPHADIAFRPSPPDNAPQGFQERNVLEMILEAREFLAAEHPSLVQRIIGVIDPFDLDADNLPVDEIFPRPLSLVGLFDLNLEPDIPAPILASSVPHTAAPPTHLDDPDYEQLESDIDDEVEKPRRCRKKTSNPNTYKKKRSSLVPLNLTRLNRGFSRYLKTYEFVMASPSARFSGQTEFVLLSCLN